MPAYMGADISDFRIAGCEGYGLKWKNGRVKAKAVFTSKCEGAMDDDMNRDQVEKASHYSTLLTVREIAVDSTGDQVPVTQGNHKGTYQ
jgi:hypothetical protein